MQLIKNRRGNAIENVFIVPYSHIDWAWRNNRQYFIHRNRQVIFAALDFLDREKSYRWEGIHRVHVFEDFWNKYPEFRKRLRKFVREGRIDLTGSALSTPLFPWYEEEALMRNLAYGKKCYEAFFGKVEDLTLYFADVPNAFAQLPQIASKFGFKYYLMDRPETALTAKGIPREFIFESPDGSRILCNQTMYGLTFPGGGDHCVLSPGSFESKTAEVARRISFIVKTSLVPVTYLPDAADWAFPSLNLPEFVSFWNKRFKAPKMIIATHTEYFKKLESFKNKLPVFKGNLDPISWNGVYGLNGEIPNSKLRRLTNQLLLAEKLDALCHLRAAKKPSSRINFLPHWKELNELYEHGGYSTSYVFPEDYRFCERRVAKMERELNSKMELAVKPMTGKGKGGWVFNQLSWERKDWIEKNDRAFMVTAPPLGYARVDAKPAVNSDLRATGNTLENQYYRLNFKHGKLAGIYLKEHEKELVDSSRNSAGEILIDEGDITLLTANFLRHHQAVYRKDAAILEKSHKISAVLRASFRRNVIAQTITLYADKKGIFIRTEIDNREPDLRYRIALPLALSAKPRIFGDDLFIVEEKNLADEPLVGYSRSRPGKGFESFFETAPGESRGENKGVFYALRFASLEDGDAGAGLLNKGTVGYVAENNVLSNILLRSSRKESMDQYGICPHVLGIGRFVFENAFYPYPAGDRPEVFKSALEFNNPLHVAWNREVKPGVGQSLLRISAPNIVLSAFYREEDGFNIHLYEAAGKPVSATLEFIRPLKRIMATDFAGHKVSALKFNGRSASVNFKPFEIKKIKVKMGV